MILLIIYWIIFISLKNFLLFDIDENTTKPKLNRKIIIKSLEESLDENKINYSKKDERINIRGKDNENITNLKGLSIILNETLITIKLLESNVVFLSDGIRIILSHVKRIFKIKKELTNKHGDIMKEYFQYEKNKSNTNSKLLEFVNIYINKCI